MDTELMIFDDDHLIEVASEAAQEEPCSIGVAANIMDVLYPSTMPPAPKNARVIRRFGFH
jgi:hypothetical protein